MTLAELLSLFKKHIGLLIALPVAFALVVGAYAYLFMQNSYTATTSMFVMVGAAANTGADGSAAAGANSSTLQSDLNSSQMITTDVADLLTSSRVERETAQALGLENLDAFDIQVSSSDSSRVIDLSVTGADPDAVVEVADTLAEKVSEVAQEVMGVESVNSVDDAQRPEDPSGPNRSKMVFIAACAGFFISVCIIYGVNLFNTRIRSEETLEDITGLPIMGRVPYVREGGAVRG